MPPLTPEEVEADTTLDSKLEAFFGDSTEPVDLSTPPADDTSPAEPEAEAEPEASVDDTPELVEDQPRDEQGRFLTKELNDPEVQEYLAKYGGDIGKALRAARESQQLIGRQGSELGELRKAIEELQQGRQPTPQSLDWETVFDQNPVGAAEAALQHAQQTGDTTAISYVQQAWEQVSPGAYQLWANNKMLEAKLNQIAEQTAPLQQQAQQHQQQTVAQEAFLAYVQDNPDARKLAAEMMQVAEQSPRILGVLQGDDPEAMREVYDFLYTKAEKQVRGRDSDTLAQAQAAKQAEQADMARTAKENAAVATSSSTKEEQTKTNVEQWKDDFRAFLFDDSTSLRSGLTTD